MKNLKDILLWIIVWLFLIRFWIEIVTTTFLKNTNLLNQINDNKIGFHHWQLGLVIIGIALLVMRIVPKWKNRVILLLGFGLALFLDQYIYVLRLIGINLPFEYRSLTDYMVIVLAMIVLVIYWKYLKIQLGSRSKA